MALYSLGYGNRPIGAVLGLLERYAITHLVDIRSVPHSRAHPDFGRAALERHVVASGWRYTYFGLELGGKSEGRTPETFRNGLRRLAGLGQDEEVAVLCAELRPEGCHRVRLVGAALAEAGVAMRHIDEHGSLISQTDAVWRTTRGQVALAAFAAPEPRIPRIARTSSP
jgi:ATP-dependent DNA helicase RecQ